MMRVLKAALVVACCVAVLSAGLPALSIHMMGIDREVTILGISEFFLIIESFDVNRLLSSVHIAPLVGNETVRVGIVEIPMKSVLDAMNLSTLADLTGEISDIAFPTTDLPRIQGMMRLLIAGAVLALALAHWRKGAALRAILGMLLCAGMVAVMMALSHQVDAFHRSVSEMVAQVMSITPHSLRVRLDAPGVYVLGMILYAVLSLCQCAIRKRKVDADG